MAICQKIHVTVTKTISSGSETVDPLRPECQTHYFRDFMTTNQPMASSATYLPKVNPLIHADPTDFSQISTSEFNILSELQSKLNVAGFFLDKLNVWTSQANILLEGQVVVNDITTPKKGLKENQRTVGPWAPQHKRVHLPQVTWDQIIHCSFKYLGVKNIKGYFQWYPHFKTTELVYPQPGTTERTQALELDK